MKNVPGKKTDIKDSEWIATVMHTLKRSPDPLESWVVHYTVLGYDFKTVQIIIPKHINILNYLGKTFKNTSCTNAEKGVIMPAF